MYDSQETSNYLSAINPVVVLDAGTPSEKSVPFELEYHSPQEVQEANDYFDNLIDIGRYKNSCDTSNPKIIFKNKNYKLSFEELRWMENETILCKWDANYFLTRYYQILDHTGKYVLYNPLTPQKVNMRIFADMQRKGRAIRKWTVKARQQGETAFSQGVVLQRLAYFPNLVSMISSLDSDSTREMAKKFTNAMNLLPYWNRPKLKSYTAGDEYLYEHGSTFDLGWGTQKSLGRGRTPVVSHCSEIPFYNYPWEAIDDALINSMHETIWLLQLFEGTAEQRDDYFHVTTQQIAKGMKAGTTSLVLCFHPWCARDDIFPTEEWLRARSDAFERWKPSLATIAHANKLREWVLNNEYYRAEWGSKWRLSREQAFYYETLRDEAISKNRLQAFLKEKPSDIEEAFQYAGQGIYPVQTMIEISDLAQEITPEVYKLRGDPNEIPPEFFPSYEETKYNGKVIDIRSAWSDSIPYSEYQLVQINWEGWDHFDPVNKILIWEHPTIAEYGCAIDTSEGLGREVSDDAVIEILKKGTIEYKDKQVCEFASPELPQNILWPWTLALGTYYSQFTEERSQILMAPEINKGTELLTSMQHRGWDNFFGMLDMTKVVQDYVVRKLGFETNKQTRPDLINHVNAFIIGKFIEIHSVELIKELKNLTTKKTAGITLGQKRPGKIVGKSDNRFMAFGICLYALHRDELIGLAKRTWDERAKGENNRVSLKSYKPEIYTRDSQVFYVSEDMEQIEEEITELIYELDEVF